MEKEIWKDVKGYEEYYEINQYGIVKSKDRIIVVPDYQNAHAYCSGFSYVKPGRILKQQISIHGYKVVLLTIAGKKKLCKVHRLVAQTFIDNPNNLLFVNHKDEDKTNNHVNNLEWCTVKYNINYGSNIHRRQITQRITNKNMKSVIAYDDENQIEFISIRGAARELKLNQANIQRAIKTNTRCGKYYWKFK